MADPASFRAERALVEFLRAHPDVAGRIVVSHRPDHQGNCAGCHLQRHYTPAPCRLSLLAAEALGSTAPEPSQPEPARRPSCPMS